MQPWLSGEPREAGDTGAAGLGSRGEGTLPNPHLSTYPVEVSLQGLALKTHWVCKGDTRGSGEDVKRAFQGPGDECQF